MLQFQEISHAYSILSDKQKRDKYDRFGDDEELEGDVDMEAFMAMFGEIFASMGGPGGMFGDLDDDDMDDFFMEMGMGGGGPGMGMGMGMGGMGMPPGMMGSMFAGMDPDDLGSDEEEEILQEFMMAHSEQVLLMPRCYVCSVMWCSQAAGLQAALARFSRPECSLRGTAAARCGADRRHSSVGRPAKPGRPSGGRNLPEAELSRLSLRSLLTYIPKWRALT